MWKFNLGFLVGSDFRNLALIIRKNKIWNRLTPLQGFNFLILFYHRAVPCAIANALSGQNKKSNNNLILIQKPIIILNDKSKIHFNESSS